MKNLPRTIFANLKDFLFPEKCLVCKRVLEREKFLPHICKDCFLKIEINSAPFCPVCKRRLPLIYRPRSRKLYVPACFHPQKKYLSWLGAATSFESQAIKSLIEAYKYKFIRNISLTLAAILLTYLEKSGLKEIIEKEDWILVPLPLHRQRKNWRGFNQAALLAEKISPHLKIRYRDNLLRRVKPTKEQAALSLKEREKNIKGAFLARHPKEVKGEKILILDDVYTSGETMREAAKTLKEAGAKKVAGLVVALAK